jgi:hypothetical protein
VQEEGVGLNFHGLPVRAQQPADGESASNYWLGYASRPRTDTRNTMHCPMHVRHIVVFIRNLETNLHSWDRKINIWVHFCVPPNKGLTMSPHWVGTNHFFRWFCFITNSYSVTFETVSLYFLYIFKRIPSYLGLKGKSPICWSSDFFHCCTERFYTNS